MSIITPEFISNATNEETNRFLVQDAITELLRNHAKNLIASALEVEVNAVLGELNQNGIEAIRNGYLPAREITTAIGNVEVNVPRIRSKSCGEAVNFTSTLIPKYLRRSKSVSAWAAYAYLKGISEKNIASVLEVVLGKGAKKLSPSVLSQMKKSWVKDFDNWNNRDLSKHKFLYVYCDGIYQEIRGDNPKVCVLVMIGVDETGNKHVIALEDGIRESTQSWRELLLGLKARGLSEPKLCVGDGAMGLWAAISEIYPNTLHQRCFIHKTVNILNYMPKAIQSKAKSDIQQIWMSDCKKNAEKAMNLFKEKYQDKYPKAVNCLIKDRDTLLTFYRFPAIHWAHIRTTNPIESTFATLRHRTRNTNGAYSKDSALSMMFQLAMEAEKTYKKISGLERLADIINGVVFEDGIPVEATAI